MNKNIAKRIVYFGTFVFITAIFCFYIYSIKAVGPVNVYYSVGQSSTTNMMLGLPTITINSGTATFSIAQTGNIGVGDKITYNTNSVAYISSKASTTVWNVITATGGTPDNVTGQTVNSITRAFASLSEAETASANSDHLNTSDLTSGGGYILNLPCYNDTLSVASVDTTAVVIDGWTTSADDYIKIYTPYDTTNESNNSQRHNGKWDETKYRLEITNPLVIIDIVEDFVRIEGLQIKLTANTAGHNVLFIENPGANSQIYISNNIFRGVLSGTADSIYGIMVAFQGENGILKLWNNIFYDFNNPGYTVNMAIRSGYYGSIGTTYAYNNTVHNSYRGFRNLTGTFIAKNNIAQNCTYGFSGTFTASDYNISDVAGDTTGGVHDKGTTTVMFVDEDNDDFHLSFSDTEAIDAGTSLSTDPDGYLSFTTDIDNETRSGDWDIGADEVDNIVPILSFTDNVSALATSTDTITADWGDSASGKKKWMYDDNTDCSETIGDYAYDDGDSLDQSTAENNGKYICLYGEDAAGNKSTLASSNPININSFQSSVPNRFSTIMVEDQSATVQVILNGSFTFRIAYSTSEAMSSLSYSDASTVGSLDDVKRVTVNNLTPGETYYFKVQSSADGITWTNPLEGDVAKFRIPPPSGEDVTYMIVSDGHFKNNILRDNDGNSIDYVYKDGCALDYTTPAGVVYYLTSNTIEEIDPDFVVFTGDEYGTVPTLTGDSSYENRYKELTLAFASIGRPIYFVPGNHDGDLGETFYQTSLLDLGFWQGDLARYNDGPGGGDGIPRTTRTKYLMSPENSGGVVGRYGYLDYGDARLFFLTPYPYSTQPPSSADYNGSPNVRPYDLGTVQATWYANAVSSATGKFKMVFIHQIPYAPESPQFAVDYPGSATDYPNYVYGWGLPARAATEILPAATWGDKGSNVDLFNPIEDSDRNFLFIGHIHAYSHQLWNEKLNVYSLPRPIETCWDWDSVLKCAGQSQKEIESSVALEESAYAGYEGYYGAYNSLDYYNSAASMVVKITNGNNIEIYGVQPDGDIESEISDDQYSYDIIPPVLSSGSPSGTVSSLAQTLSVTSDENATCKYSTTAGTAYTSMVTSVTTTGGTSHSMVLPNLTSSTNYNYYIRCIDSSGNYNTTDYTISFTTLNSGSVPIHLIPQVNIPQIQADNSNQENNQNPNNTQSNNNSNNNIPIDNISNSQINNNQSIKPIINKIKYIFKRYLVLGSLGTEVRELQKRLNELKLLNVKPTGYFGSLTRKAVMLFQKINNIQQTGTVGPKTRRVLNR